MNNVKNCAVKRNTLYAKSDKAIFNNVSKNTLRHSFFSFQHNA